MSKLQETESAEYRGARRLLWLLVFFLLLLGALNIFVSAVLPGALQRWLHERGLEAQIEYLNVSLPSLRAHLRNVRVRNKFERGFQVGEATLGLSWWQLLRGKIHVKLVDLDDVYIDLESEPGERGRIWEIGGWHLGEGEKKPKNWRVDLTSARVRSGVVCYQHKPQWDTPTCVRLGQVELDDFFVSGFREAQEPLRFAIGADDFTLDNLLAWDEQPQTRSPSSPGALAQEPGDGGDMRRSPGENLTVALVRLKTGAIRFERPGNQLTVAEASVRKFAGCPPERWAEAVPGLQRITGHCASARRLQVRGPASFSFGKQSEIAWYRVNGQDVRLRYRNRRQPNWHAQTLAINDFDFLRDEKSLTWQSAGASGFSWCPNRLRSGQHHYCLSAGSLRLPQPTQIAWHDGLQAELAEVSLDQGTVLDMEASRPAPNPLNTSGLRLGALRYQNSNRRLELEQLSLEGAAGCVPGQLWGRKDHCVSVAGLKLPENFALQFPRKLAADNGPVQSWRLESGPLELAKFQMRESGGGKKAAAADSSSDPSTLLLSRFNWARAEIAPDERHYLLEDVALGRLGGCVPDGWLPQRLSPLCARLWQLQGRGNFILDLQESPYLVLGELRLATLLLSDQLSADPAQQTGLALNELYTGNGFFRMRRQALQAGEYFASGDAHWWGEAESAAAGAAAEEDSDGAEKGLLPEELKATRAAAEAAARTAIGRSIVRRETELELASLSLTSLDGCLPTSWQVLLVSGNKRRPECFAVHQLRQQQPLQLRVADSRDQGNTSGGGLRLGFSAAELTLERADITSADDESLLAVTQLKLPQADIRLQSQPARARLQLPGAELDKADFCLNPARCVDVTTLRTGGRFALDYAPDHFNADLNDLVLAHFSLSGDENLLSAEIDQLAGKSLQVNLPRRPGASADWKLQQLQADKVEVCWPSSGKQGGEQLARGNSGRRLPRCARGEGLQSEGSGVALAQLALYRSLADPPQLTLGRLHVEKLGVAQRGGPAGNPVQLNLHNLSLETAHGCGLDDWLAASEKDRATWRGCLSSGPLHLGGDNLVRLGSGRGNEDRIQLGPLQAADLQLVPAQRETPKLQLSQLAWQSLSWAGGARIQVENLAAQGVSGCLPPVLGSTNSDTGDQPMCISIGRLQLAGSPSLEKGEVLRLDGAVTVEDFALRQDNRLRLGFTRLGLNGLALSANALELQRGELSGISGCLSPFKLGEKSLAPCYEVDRVSIGSEHKIMLAEGRSGSTQRHFRNFRVEGLRMTQADFPAGLPSPLLEIDTVEAAELGFGARELVSENLLLKNIRSCVPRGYIDDVDFCFDLQELLATGHFDVAARRLELAQVRLDQLRVRDTDGDRLLETEYADARALTIAKDVFRLLYLEIADSKLFHRDERAQDYVNHPWNTEIELLRLDQFEYFPAEKILNIDTIDLIKPHSMLARGPEGDLGAWQRFRSETPALKRYHFQREDIAQRANRFRYRVRQLVVDQGRFLWLDNTYDYQAMLPVHRVNMLWRGLSNYNEDPPALMLLSARPGGFSEMHLSGQVNLLENNHWDASLLGYVEGANLIPATPYMAALLGYKILQGQLNAVVDMKVEDNQVDALAQMELQKIKVRRVRDSDHLKVKRSIIPLGLALALLKDGNGDVRFKMPVTGDLYDPKFSFSFIFSDLLQRAILEALFAYFTPVGVYSLAKLAWARFRAPSFSELEFAPGSDELSASATASLNSMIEEMRDNPKARPGICAVATVPDLENMFPYEVSALRTSREQREAFYRDPPRGLREELLELSSRRSRQVQKFFIDAGLDQKDFIQCAPDYVGSDFGAPRVEFSN
ncbi:DUF748 domain-containing protein [Microbulbifer pacificus]|uniref:DUF748 domain-containing protein n=1 Tax=Microbulbifer pacificus TaxID=407164 RepID=A0AAU0N1I9_9GAMM|nr:DUF748 domain-containing protein [Microbulbifer pacificus]WOX06822.1 DUF748 domain-containing protein [Microbulbifer pacificus]